MSEEAYQKVKQIKTVCLQSKSKDEAKSKLEQMGLWYEWVPEVKAYQELPA